MGGFSNLSSHQTNEGGSLFELMRPLIGQLSNQQKGQVIKQENRDLAQWKDKAQGPWTNQHFIKDVTIFF